MVKPNYIDGADARNCILMCLKQKALVPNLEIPESRKSHIIRKIENTMREAQAFYNAWEAI